MTTALHAITRLGESRRGWLWVAGVILSLVGCREATPPPPVIRSSPVSSTPQAAQVGEPIVVTPPVPRPTDYVGSQVCAECHLDISRTYAKTTMANSAAVAKETKVIEHYPSDWVISSRGFQLSARQTEAGPVHTEQLLSEDKQVLCDQNIPIALELGSGKRGRSYLLERDDQLMMSPLTWYSMALRWDVSPGYQKNNYHFERVIVEACVQCHVGRIAPADSPLENRFAQPALLEAGIGCERCHGPAGRHVAFRREREKATSVALAGPDPIVNPAALAPELRESVCNESHMLGAERVLRMGMKDHDFRPGDPLHSVWVIFKKGDGGVGSDQTTDAVNQVQQMESSQCFQKSQGALGCVSCHDPHSQPEEAERASYYRSKCVTCHQSPARECAAPVAERVLKSPEDSCIACHMPSLTATDVQHTSQTDHRVLKNPATPTPAIPNERLQLAAGMETLPEWETQRARGILMAQFASEMNDPALATLAGEVLEPLTSRGLQDYVVERALGDAYLMQNRLAVAEQHWRRALELHPHDEQTLRSLSIAIHDAGRDEEAESLFSQYLKTNRWDRVILGRHIHVLGRLQRQPEAMQEAEDALKKFPADRLMRQWMADACEAAGRRDEAKTHRIIAERLAPRQ